MKFIVLCSSRGSTFQATIEAMKSGALQAECIGLVADAPDKECITKAEAAGIPVAIARKEKGQLRTDYDQLVHQALLSLCKRDGTKPSEVVVAAMGWMWILGDWLIGQWPNQMLNVHPALLPKYGGKGMYGIHVHKAVLAAGETETGMTIHIMDTGVDTGAIVVQKNCSISPADTPEIVQQRVQQLEKEWYPKTLQMIHDGQLILS